MKYKHELTLRPPDHTTGLLVTKPKYTRKQKQKNLRVLNEAFIKIRMFTSFFYFTVSQKNTIHPTKQNICFGGAQISYKRPMNTPSESLWRERCPLPHFKGEECFQPGKEGLLLGDKGIGLEGSMGVWLIPQPCLSLTWAQFPLREVISVLQQNNQREAKWQMRFTRTRCL